MVEPGGQNEYETMSPKERNQELKRLIETFPSTFFAPSREEVKEELSRESKTNKGSDDLFMFVRIMERRQEDRENSQLRQVVFSRIDSLLALTNTTGSFKRAITEMLDEDFISGVNFEELTPIQNYLPVLLDQDNTENEGIFGSGAKSIERYIYSHFRRYNLTLYLHNKVIGDIANSELEDPSFDDAIKISPVRQILEESPDFFAPGQEIKDQLSIWRDEFKAKYGEELDSPTA